MLKAALTFLILLTSATVVAQSDLEKIQSRQKKNRDKHTEQVKASLQACTAVTAPKDVKGRNLSLNVQKEFCVSCTPKTQPKISNDSIKLLNHQIDNAFKHVSTNELWSDINTIALKKTAQSVWATRMRLIKDEKLTESSAVKVICDNAPSLCKNKNDLATIKAAYKSFSASIAKTPIKYMSGTEQANILKNEVQPLIERANKTCQKTKETYQKIKRDHACVSAPQLKKDAQGKIQITAAKPYSESECNIQLDKAYAKHKQLQSIATESMKLDMQLIVGSKIGSLLITEKLRKKLGVMDEDFAYKSCMKGDGKILTQIWNKDIIQARNDFYSLTVQELRKIASNKSSDASENSKKQTLKQYLKTNPSTVAELLKTKPSQNKVYAMCSLIKSIQGWDKAWMIGEGVVVGTGVVASIALGFTGVGAPAGAALAGVVLGSTVLTVSKSAIDYGTAIHQDQKLRMSVATKQKQLNQGLDDLLKSDKEKKQALNNMMFAAGAEVVGFGVGKGLKLLTQYRQVRSLKALSAADQATAAKRLETSLSLFQKEQKTLGKSASHLAKLTLDQEADVAMLFSRLSPESAKELTKKMAQLKTSDELTKFLKEANKQDALKVDGLKRLVDASKTNPPMYIVISESKGTKDLYKKLTSKERTQLTSGAKELQNLKFSEKEILEKLALIQKNCLKNNVISSGCFQTAMTNLKEEIKTIKVAKANPASADKPVTKAEIAEVRQQNNLISKDCDVSQKSIIIGELAKNTLNAPRYFAKCGLNWMRQDEYFTVLNKYPEKFGELFGPNSLRQIPNNRHNFDFHYTDVNAVCDNNFGFCRGYTVSQTRWQRLAFYDKDLVHLGDAPRPPAFIARKEGQSLADFHAANKEFFDYYKPKIDAIQAGEPTIIPGFTDLREFSSNPILKHYMMEHVAKKWASENANIHSLTRVLPKANQNQSVESLTLMHERLVNKIEKLNYNPTMMVVRPQEESWLKGTGYYHVMQAFHVTPIKNNRYSIYLQDLDFTDDFANVRRLEIDLSENRPKILGDVIFDKTPKKGLTPGTGYYEFGAVSSIKEVPFDDVLVGQDMKKLAEFYEKYPSFKSSPIASTPAAKKESLEKLLEKAETTRYVRQRGKYVFDIKPEDITVAKLDTTDPVEVKVSFDFRGKKKEVSIPREKFAESDIELIDSREFRKFLILKGYIDDLLIYF